MSEPNRIDEHDLASLLESISGMEDSLASMKEILIPEDLYDDKKEKTLAELHGLKNLFTKKEFVDIAMKHGYTRRGAMGLIAGHKSGWRTPIIPIAGNKFALAPWVEQYLLDKGYDIQPEDDSE